MELTVKIWILCFYLLTLRNTVPSSQPTQSPRFLLVFSLSLSVTPSLSHSLYLSCYTNPLQSPFHPKLKLRNVNKSSQSIKCITLTPHKTLTITVLQFSEILQGDSKRWTQFRTSIFPKLAWYINVLYNIWKRKSEMFKFTARALA